MTNEEIQSFNIKITQANNSELLILTYDILLKYLEDAELKYKQNIESQQELKNAQRVLAHLIEVLDYKYEISYQLFNLYRYFNRVLSKAILKKDIHGILEIKKMLLDIQNAFVQISKGDTSSAVMKNAHQVYAGLTYGKSSLNETIVTEDGYNRGFKV